MADIITTPVNVNEVMDTTTAKNVGVNNDVDNMACEYEQMIQYHSTASVDHRAMAVRLRKLFKTYTQVLKRSKRVGAKRTRSARSSPAGFNKPVLVSSDLASFLEIDPAVPVCRTDITRKLTCYFKEHDIPNPANRREMILDENKPACVMLMKLFPEYTGKDGKPALSYFNLQKALKPFFQNITTPPPLPVEAEVEADVEADVESEVEAETPSGSASDPIPKKMIKKIVRKMVKAS